MSLAALAAPADMALARQMIARQAVEATPVVYELDIVAKGGRTVPLEVSTRLIAEEVLATGAVGVASELNTRRQSEVTPNQANRQLTLCALKLDSRNLDT